MEGRVRKKESQRRPMMLAHSEMGRDGPEAGWEQTEITGLCLGLASMGQTSSWGWPVGSKM